MTVWHTSMDSAKWNRYSRERQILMIGSEFARAKNLLRDEAYEEVARCHERAFELLDLCAMDPQWRPRLREVLRFREMLGELYINISNDDPRFMHMYRTLMNWSGDTSRVEL